MKILYLTNRDIYIKLLYLFKQYVFLVLLTFIERNTMLVLYIVISEKTNLVIILLKHTIHIDNNLVYLWKIALIKEQSSSK